MSHHSTYKSHIAPSLRKLCLFITFQTSVTVTMSLSPLPVETIKNSNYDRILSGKNWMQNLPLSIKNRKINEISIPASHDSPCFYLNTTAPFAQNADQSVIDIITRFARTEGIAKRISKKWGVTQLMDIESQLSIGVRYIDLRIMPKVDEVGEPLYTAHSLYAESLETILRQVRDFVEENSEEVIFLDMNHFYGMTDSDHARLKSLIEDVLGKHVHHSGNGIVPELTLSEMQRTDARVLIFYHNSDFSPYFEGSQMISHWANGRDPYYITEYASDWLSQGRPDSSQFFVSQMVMTEDGKTIVKQPFKGLRKWESQLLKPLNEWVKMQHAGDRVHGVNFVLMDFITEDWVKDIVEVNWRTVV